MKLYSTSIIKYDWIWAYLHKNWSPNFTVTLCSWPFFWHRLNTYKRPGMFFQTADSCMILWRHAQAVSIQKPWLMRGVIRCSKCDCSQTSLSSVFYENYVVLNVYSYMVSFLTSWQIILLYMQKYYLNQIATYGYTYLLVKVLSSQLQ